MSKTVMTNRIAWFVLCLVCLGSFSHEAVAQSARRLVKAADRAFKQHDYYTATRYYAAALYDSPLVKKVTDQRAPYQYATGRSGVKAKQRAAVIYQLAESYRLLGDPGKARQQYEQLAGMNTQSFPYLGLWYGITQVQTNEPVKGIAALQKFLDQHKKEDDTYTAAAKTWLATAAYLMAEAGKRPQASISKMNGTGASDGSHFAFEKLPDNQGIFSSSRREGEGRNLRYPFRLYQIDDADTARKLNFPGNKNLQTAASSMSVDGLTMYFTGVDPSKKQSRQQIYYSTRQNRQDNWQEPVLMPAPVNEKETDSKHPQISSDGKYLFFATNRSGGQGGFDIWMVAMNGQTPVGNAIPAGPSVNTTADELSPFFRPADSSLYFSSDGRKGFGGQDIYLVKGDPATMQWDSVLHLGMPYNSTGNDLYYRPYQQTDTAYLSSDRNAGCCLEIFQTVRLPYMPPMLDTMTNARVQEQPRTQTIEKNIPAADSATKPVLPKIEQEAWKDSLDAITTGRLFVYYAFASARIRKADQAVLDKVVAALNADDSLNVLVASFTDCIGSRPANEKLSRKRSAAVRAYLLAKGIAEERINMDFFGKRYFLKACKEDTSYRMAEQMTNRRSELILTKEQHPKWKPSGKEVDLNNDLPVQSEKAVAGKETTSEELRSRKTAAATTESTVDAGRRNRTEPSQEQSTRADKNKQAMVRNAASDRSRTEKEKPVPESVQPRRQQQAATAGKAAGADKLRVNDLLDFIPRLKKPSLVEEMTKRAPRKPLFLYTTSDSVRIDLYDNGSFDYDTISVIFNKEVVIYKELLQTHKPVTFYIKLSSDQLQNEMIFFAESLGLTPPNSALMVITDGNKKRTEFNISSDLNNNTVVYFIKVNQ